MKPNKAQLSLFVDQPLSERFESVAADHSATLNDSFQLQPSSKAGAPTGCSGVRPSQSRVQFLSIKLR